jgi:endonuclease G
MLWYFRFLGFLFFCLVSACSPGALESELDAARKGKSSFCLGACPEVKKGNRLVKHEIFALSNNPNTKFADWAAYRVSPQTIGNSQGKDRSWAKDPLLNDTETLEPNDYEGAFEQLEVDRGHQVPLASFAGTDYWKSTNYLSNITPQKSTLNKGVWKRLEDLERKLAINRDDSVYVLTGPLYEGTVGELPNADEKHRVPSGYWKVLLLEEGDRRLVASFLFDQDEDRDAQVCERFSTLAVLSKKSGLDLKRSLADTSFEENDQIRDEIECPNKR